MWAHTAGQQARHCSQPRGSHLREREKYYSLWNNFVYILINPSYARVLCTFLLRSHSFYIFPVCLSYFFFNRLKRTRVCGGEGPPAYRKPSLWPYHTRSHRTNFTALLLHFPLFFQPSWIYYERSKLISLLKLERRKK